MRFPIVSSGMLLSSNKLENQTKKLKKCFKNPNQKNHKTVEKSFYKKCNVFYKKDPKKDIKNIN